MDGILNKKLRDWFQEAYAQIKLDELTKDIHIDELYYDYKLLDRRAVLSLCYDLFNELTNLISENKIELSDTGVYLSIDLVSESNVFSGAPKTKAAVIDSIEMYSVPEIILYKTANPVNISLTEFYRIPLLMEGINITPYIATFYKEYRSKEDLLNDGDYARELNIMYFA